MQMLWRVVERKAKDIPERQNGDETPNNKRREKVHRQGEGMTCGGKVNGGANRSVNVRGEIQDEYK